MNIRQLHVQDIKLADIRTSAYNPRKELQPGDKTYERLKQSILTFGYVDPLIYNQRTGQLVGGHQRFRIMKDLGMESAQVSVVDLDEKEEKALNLALNKVQGEFREDALAEILQELAAEEYDLDNLGFDEKEYEDLLRQLDFQQEKRASFLDTFLQPVHTAKEEQIFAQLVNVNEYENSNVMESQIVPTQGVPLVASTPLKRQNVSAPSPDFPTMDAPLLGNTELYGIEETEKAVMKQPATGAQQQENDERCFKVVYPVTYEERELLLAAINKAKKVYDLRTSTDAIVQICRNYLLEGAE